MVCGSLRRHPFSSLWTAFFVCRQKFFIEYGNVTVDVLYTGVPIIILAVLDQVGPYTGLGALVVCALVCVGV